MNSNPMRTAQDSRVDKPIELRPRSICPYCIREIKNASDHNLCRTQFPRHFEIRREPDEQR